MVDLDWIGTDEQTQEWLDTFAETLNGLGWAGKITAAPQVFFPEDMDDDMRHTCLTCYVALTVDDPTGYFAGGQGQWLADAELTREWCDYAAGWAILPGATTYLSEATSRVIVDDPRPARELMTAAQRSAQATVVNLVPNPYRARFLSFDFHARITFQSGAAADGTPTPDWRDQLPSVTEALLHRPACLDYGLILPQWLSEEVDSGPTPTSGQPPTWTTVSMAQSALVGHLCTRRYAIQVITRDHLDKAHDLSEWSVTEVAYERYLVQARDLGAWWDDPEPSPEIIDRARQDFGAMITTYDVIQADPHGWLPGRGGSKFFDVARGAVAPQPTRRSWDCWTQRRGYRSGSGGKWLQVAQRSRWVHQPC